MTDQEVIERFNELVKGKMVQYQINQWMPWNDFEKITTERLSHRLKPKPAWEQAWNKRGFKATQPESREQQHWFKWGYEACQEDSE